MLNFFGLGRTKNGEYIPQLGEIILYKKTPEEKVWETRVGDGKTPAKDIPPVVSHDFYQRLAKLEKEVERLKKLNDRRI